MGEFEDKLNSILSSPKDMEKILGLARELSGSLGGDGQKDSAAANASPKQQPSGFDPKLLALFTKLMGEYNSQSSDKTAIISSIKPYVKEERRTALDRAVKIARLAHVARLAFSEFSGGDFDFGL